ncbi:DoxX family protein [Chitinimonas sp.]|uniref:DoxX family protein n=1 Tax=Chitinimonas sp. TaxID=1934313 RepID=UPI0035AFB4FC
MNHLVTVFIHRARCINGMVERYLAPLIDLAARIYIGRVFFLSGLTKLNDWDTTIALFTDEYHVPVLPPALAAVMGTAGELLMPVLLVVGIGGRFGALGLSAVNAMAVVSYYHVLSQNDALLTHHLLWGIILALLFAHGPGKLSVDTWLAKRFAN